MKSIKVKSRKAQVWVETVTYTLIALVLIGAVLAFVKPKLDEMKDKAVLDQTLEMMEYLNKDVSDTGDGAAGSKRTPEFTIKQGFIEIFTKDYNDTIVFTLEKSNSEYTEPGKLVRIGNVIINTTDRGKYNTIKFALEYKNRFDLADKDGNSGKLITVPKSSTTQKISFTNMGKNGGIRKDSLSTACSTHPCVGNEIYERGSCVTVTGICEYEDTRPKIIVELN
jgi:hypothetical protein